jgi:2-keto-3-deoxy-L-rhamnonate aldolase RhmA
MRMHGLARAVRYAALGSRSDGAHYNFRRRCRYIVEDAVQAKLQFRAAMAEEQALRILTEILATAGKHSHRTPSVI